jgi:hypothetical protein
VEGLCGIVEGLCGAAINLSHYSTKFYSILSALAAHFDLIQAKNEWELLPTPKFQRPITTDLVHQAFNARLAREVATASIQES